MKIISIGEILWDVFGEKEFLGGAPLNFSATLQRLGNAVTLISGVGQDIRGSRALQEVLTVGLSTEFVKVVSGRDTGTAVVTIDSSGNANYLIARPAAFDDLELDGAHMSRLRDMRLEWIYYGTLAQTSPINEALVCRLLQEMPGVKRFYDLNLRSGHWNLELVERLSRLASVVKLNEEEAELLFKLTRSSESFSLESFCKHWSSAYAVDTICITRGPHGCAIFTRTGFHLFEGFKVSVVDTVGAGDAFAAAFLHASSLKWPIPSQAAFANALGALVASRAGAIPDWTSEECLQLIASQRQ